MVTFSEEALNTVQPTWRHKTGKKFMFSLKVSEGIENCLVFDTDFIFCSESRIPSAILTVFLSYMQTCREFLKLDRRSFASSSW